MRRDFLILALPAYKKDLFTQCPSWSGSRCTSPSRLRADPFNETIVAASFNLLPVPENAVTSRASACPAINTSNEETKGFNCEQKSSTLCALVLRAPPLRLGIILLH